MTSSSFALAILTTSTVFILACGDDETTTGSGGSGGSAATTSSVTSSGGPTTTGSTATTTATGSTSTGGIDCTANPQDPNACPMGYGCACGGPGAQVVCTCGLVCTDEAQCTNPDQPVCCGGGMGQSGICTDSCTCFCD